MKSLVVFLVDNGEDTDGLAGWIDKARGIGVTDYDLAVDVSEDEDFTLDFTGETVYLRRFPDGGVLTPYR